MKTTDLLYQNLEVLNLTHEMLSHTKKHVEFLATGSPEIRSSLESIAESIQLGVDILEDQIVLNRDTRSRFAKEVACKNQVYDFIAAEKLIGLFKTFCECNPTNTYTGLTGAETLQDR